MIEDNRTFITHIARFHRLSKGILLGSLAVTLLVPIIQPQTVSAAQQKNEAMDQRQNGVFVQQRATATSVKQGNRALIDRQIRSINGEVIGKIENVVIDNTGQVRYVIASIEGEWGMGSEEAMVPIEKLQLTTRRSYVYFKGTKEELEMYPNYSDYGWGERRYGSTPNAVFNREMIETDGDKDRAGSNPMLDRDRRKHARETLQASKLLDKQVRNKRGEVLGEVVDVVITPTGNSRLIIFIGEALNVNDKKVQADLQDIRMTEDADYIVYDVSREELKNDPGYSSDKHAGSLSQGARSDGSNKEQ